MIDSALTLVGSLVETPEPRTTTSGLTVTSFRLACTPRRFDRSQNRWVDCSTMFITVACWRQLAENVVGSLRRGDKVLVAGRLRQRVYQLEDGTRRASIEIDAEAIGPDLGRHAVNVRRPAREPVPIPVQGRPAPLPPMGPAGPPPVPARPPVAAEGVKAAETPPPSGSSGPVEGSGPSDEQTTPTADVPLAVAPTPAGDHSTPEPAPATSEPGR